MVSIANKKVLIADDSQIVLSSLRSMLAKIGVKESNVFSSKSVKSAINIAHENKFDIVISDYNFGKGLNGKQLYEELLHYNLISVSTVFIIITGDNSKKSVRTLIELNPDEYILKPFNSNDLKERLFRSIKRKKILNDLYVINDSGNYKKGIEICDDLLAFHPEYHFVIEKFKGAFLSKLSLYEQAKGVYGSILKRKEFLWAKVGYANSLANLGEFKEADKMLSQMLTVEPFCIETNAAAANVSLLKYDVPQAIKHYEVINSLTFGNSERELILVNLCLAQNDYKEALDRYEHYQSLNKDTYRDNAISKLNKMRIMLYYCSVSKGCNSKILNEIKLLYKAVVSNYSNEIRSELDLVLAHISLESKQYNLSLQHLRLVLNKNGCHHFYSIYHLGWLFDYLCCESEFADVLVRLSKSLRGERNNNVLASKIAMIEQLVIKNKAKIAWLDERLNLSSVKTKLEELDDLIDVKEKYPLIKSVNFKIIKLLTDVWPSGKGSRDVINIIEDSNNVVLTFFTEKELNNFDYRSLYLKARENCERHSVIERGNKIA